MLKGRQTVQSQNTAMLRIPGFVDLQINGWAGVDFASVDLTPAAAERAFAGILSSGTVAFLPTLITAPLSVYRRNLPLLADLLDKKVWHGRVLGLHLEGPFISAAPGAVGCHPVEYVCKPDTKLLDELVSLSRGHLRLLTIAADVDGADKLASAARAAGVTVSLGHHNGGVEALSRLAASGASMVTHAGNGMPAQAHRHDNPLLATAAMDELCATIIADGHHLPVNVVKILLRTKGVKRLAVVSDAAPVAGLPPGPYSCFGREVEVEVEQAAAAASASSLYSSLGERGDGFGGQNWGRAREENPEEKQKKLLARGENSADTAQVGRPLLPPPAVPVVRDPERGCLAGSAASMLHCLNWLHHHKAAFGLELEQLEELGFYNPLRLVGLNVDAVAAAGVSADGTRGASSRLNFHERAGFTFSTDVTLCQ